LCRERISQWLCLSRCDDAMPVLNAGGAGAKYFGR
jgi:hypothetical protein